MILSFISQMIFHLISSLEQVIQSKIHNQITLHPMSIIYSDSDITVCCLPHNDTRRKSRLRRMLIMMGVCDSHNLRY